MENMNSFKSRLLPAPLNGGFRMDGYWVWCGSVIKGEDGKYHMFASRWTDKLSFSPHWITNSEVVRAVSDTPEGPYEFQEVVLPPRGSQFWDGRMTHNPTIHKHEDTYLLYYTGTTYDQDMPNPENPTTQDSPIRDSAHKNERVGVAFSKSIFGPWIRSDKPILETIPDSWESRAISNPAPCILKDGSILLIYKASGEDKKPAMGIAKANNYKGPYIRLIKEPFNMGKLAEDAYVWFENGQYHSLMLDYARKYSEKELIYGSSENGLEWTLDSDPVAITKNILWDDGVIRKVKSTERPQILLENGKATHVFMATGLEVNGIRTTWNMVIPLKH